MKKAYIITTAMAGLATLTGGMLSSCSDEAALNSIKQTETKGAAYTADAVSSSTAEARAQVFPALAVLPKGTNTYLTGNVSELIKTINTIAGKQVLELPAEAQALDSVAIGITEGTETTLGDFYDTYQWIYKELMAGQQPDMDKLVKKLADTARKIKPIYLVVSCPTEDEAKALLAQLNFALILAQKNAPFIKFTQQGSWNLINCTVADIPAELAGADLSACGDLKLTLATTTQGKAVVACLTTNPQELQLPATAADSVLGTTAADALDDAVAGKGIAAINVSPNLINALRTHYTKLLRGGISGYKEMAARTGTDTEDIEQVFDSLHTLLDFFEKLTPNSTHPGAITLWQDGNVHLTLKGDACGVEFSTAQLNTTVPQQAIVYAYGSGMSNSNIPASAEFDRVAEAVFTLVSVSKSKRAARKSREVYTSVKSLMPSLARLQDGLGAGWALQGDLSASETVTIDDDPTNIITTQLPTFCIMAAAKLANRATFESAVADTIAGLKAIEEQNSPGITAEIDEALAGITKGESGAYTTYTHPALIDTKDGLNAGATISDTSVGLGTDLQKTVQFCDSISGNTAVSGIVIHINPAPIEQRLLAILKRREKTWEACKNNPDKSCVIDWKEDMLEAAREDIADFREFLQYVSGGSIRISAENGCLKTHIIINTPALKN